MKKKWVLIVGCAFFLIGFSTLFIIDVDVNSITDAKFYSDKNHYLFLFIALLIAPITEEIVFRWQLVNEKKWISLVGAALICLFLTISSAIAGKTVNPFNALFYCGERGF